MLRDIPNVAGWQTNNTLSQLICLPSSMHSIPSILRHILKIFESDFRFWRCSLQPRGSRASCSSSNLNHLCGRDLQSQVAPFFLSFFVWDWEMQRLTCFTSPSWSGQAFSWGKQLSMATSIYSWRSACLYNMGVVYTYLTLLACISPFFCHLAIARSH